MFIRLRMLLTSSVMFASPWIVCLMTLEATAEFLGFTDAAHLSRCFVQQTGVTPGQYRRQARPSSPASADE